MEYVVYSRIRDALIYLRVPILARKKYLNNVMAWFICVQKKNSAEWSRIDYIY